MRPCLIASTGQQLFRPAANSPMKIQNNRLRRLIFLAMGFFFLALGAVGAFLPLLPTTPFVLLAAGCFAESSERWHRWLLNSRTFGPLIQRWHEHRCVSTTTKGIAIGSILIFGGSAVLFSLPPLWPKLLGTAFLAICLVMVVRLQRCQPDPGN